MSREIKFKGIEKIIAIIIGLLLIETTIYSTMNTPAARTFFLISSMLIASGLIIDYETRRKK